MKLIPWHSLLSDGWRDAATPGGAGPGLCPGRGGGRTAPDLGPNPPQPPLASVHVPEMEPRVSVGRPVPPSGLSLPGAPVQRI